MQLPTLGALIEHLHLHAHAQNVNDTLTQWLSNASQLSLPLYQQYILLLLTLPILFFMLRPHSAGEDLYYMAIPMLSFCDDFYDHIAWNAHVLKHVRGYFRAMFQATRNAHSRIQPGY
jgi:predicted PurR-regulated permease PerM